MATIVTPTEIRRLARTRSFGGATPFRGREESTEIPTTMTYATVEYQIASARTDPSLCQTSDPLGMSLRPKIRFSADTSVAATHVFAPDGPVIASHGCDETTLKNPKMLITSTSTNAESV